MPKGFTLTSKPKGELKATTPSLRDKLAYLLSDTFGGGDRSRVNYINEKVKGAADLAPVLGDLIGMDETKTAWDEGRYLDAALSGATTAIGSIPGVGDAAAAGLKAGGDALGILIGPAAKGFNFSQRDRAMDMFDQGRSTDDVWRETGTMYDPKNKAYVQEISDANVRVHPNKQAWERDGKWLAPLSQAGFSTDLMDPDMLEDVLTHDEFFDNYPDARGIGVVENSALGYGSGPGGVYYNYIPQQVKNNFIVPEQADEVPDRYIGIASPKFAGGQAMGNMSPKSVAIHELQHYVQAMEGWDPGFNPNAAAATIIRPDSITTRFRDKILSDINSWPVKPQDWIPYVDDARHASHEVYRRNVGETQARLAQFRAQQDPAHNAVNLPGYDMDRNPGEQLTIDDILNGIYGADVPGLAQGLRGSVRRIK